MNISREKADSLKQEILEYFLDNRDSMISIINNEYRYEAVNSLFCELFRMNKQDLVGTSLSELWGEKTFREKIKSNIDRSLRGEIISYKANFDISGVPGKFYEVVYTPYLPEDSENKYAIVETRDITSHVEETEKARAKEGKYYFLEKHLPMGVFECSRDGIIRESNDTFRKILDLDHSKLVHDNINRFFQDDPRFIDYLKNSKVGEASTFGNLSARSDNGKELFVRISSFVRKSGDGKTVINATMEDITRETMLERKLNQTHKMETLGTLAGGIAHDFNTILTTIKGYSELTMDEVEDGSEIYKYMTNLHSAVKRAENIVNQMLVFSQQSDLEMKELKVRIILDEAIEFISYAMPMNILIKKDFKTFDDIVMADKTQLFRVFLNIMTNGVQAMEEYGGELRISLGQTIHDDKKYVTISIKDTGPGIEKDIIDRIFEPFFTTKNIDEGTGMGLSVAHGIISRMGGEINVLSKAAKGSNFIIDIPLRHAED